MDSVTIIDDARTVIERLATSDQTSPIYYDDDALNRGFCRFVLDGWIECDDFGKYYGGDWRGVTDFGSVYGMAHIIARVQSSFSVDMEVA
jgi:hypothetical protein